MHEWHLRSEQLYDRYLSGLFIQCHTNIEVLLFSYSNHPGSASSDVHDAKALIPSALPHRHFGFLRDTAGHHCCYPAVQNHLASIANNHYLVCRTIHCIFSHPLNHRTSPDLLLRFYGFSLIPQRQSCVQGPFQRRPHRRARLSVQLPLIVIFDEILVLNVEVSLTYNTTSHDWTYLLCWVASDNFVFYT